jgi:hypothetical protein
MPTTSPFQGGSRRTSSRKGQPTRTARPSVQPWRRPSNGAQLARWPTAASPRCAPTTCRRRKQRNGSTNERIEATTDRCPRECRRDAARPGAPSSTPDLRPPSFRRTLRQCACREAWRSSERGEPASEHDESGGPTQRCPAWQAMDGNTTSASMASPRAMPHVDGGSQNR